MPAIVDRSPIIVAIGSAGQSPTLARRVRAQLEAMLPERLGELAGLAGRMRERVQRALPDINQRRVFWDRLFSSPVASKVFAGSMSEAEALLEAQLHACLLYTSIPNWPSIGTPVASSIAPRYSSRHISRAWHLQ